MGQLAKLPLEILDLIFESLESLEDKLQLAKVDEVFTAAFKYHCGKEMKCLTEYDAPAHLWKDFLPLCGSTIEVVHTNKYDNDSPPFDLVEQYCPNLRVISLHLCLPNQEKVGNFLRKMKNIKEIDIFAVNATPEALNFLTDLPNLEKIWIHNNIHPEAEYQMSKWFLENMYAKGYPKTLPKPVNLYHTFSPLKKLTHLYLKGFFISSEEDNEDFSFPVLEELKFRCCTILDDFPIMPKLKKLSVACLHQLGTITTSFEACGRETDRLTINFPHTTRRFYKVSFD
ncbi:uncharacterized protein LOC108028030 [Drosophila biarmipes]|uniref:uncharacterized protein LOC108028030 n=1 Tax=Drosophila biarmipes TaxID=125945 RepID=UPI0007E70C87|nr:uncharacterized protein LOC108028030 [Drosophila biarmipes]